MNNVPNINKFGAAKRPNIKKFRGPRGSEGGGLFWQTPWKLLMFMAFLSLPTNEVGSYWPFPFGNSPLSPCMCPASLGTSFLHVWLFSGNPRLCDQNMQSPWRCFQDLYSTNAEAPARFQKKFRGLTILGEKGTSMRVLLLNKQMQNLHAFYM